MDGAKDDRDARKEKARGQWEAGEDTKVIAKTAGVSTAAVYLWAKAGKWQRPKPAASAAAAQRIQETPGRVPTPESTARRPWQAPREEAPQSVATAAPSERVELAGTVTCPSCQMKTGWDPCFVCGKPVRKKL